MNKFVHIELNTSDVKAAKKFYQGLFDWKMQDTPMGPMTYTMINTGVKNEGGGIQQKQMPDAPTQWLPYVQVESVKKTVAKAGTRGAQVIVAYQPIGEMGAIGVFVDPTGAMLGVWENAQKPAKKNAKKAKKK